MILAALASTPATFAATPEATLSMIQGEVFVEGKALSTEEKTVPVQVGNTIETKDGKATLFMNGDTVLHMDSYSQLQVLENGAATTKATRKTLVSLPFGKIRSLIKSKGTKDFRVKTRAAVMGVRGTHIFVDAPSDTQQPVGLAVFDGSAVVDLGGGAPQVKLEKNQSLFAKAEGGSSSPINLNPAEAKALADSVAPAPAAVQSGAQLDQSGQTSADAGSAATAGAGMGPGAGFGLILDPVDVQQRGGNKIRVTITGKGLAN